MSEYVFFREGVFYVVDLGDDRNFAAHVECNPGTRRIEDLSGNCVWRLPGSDGERPKS